MCYESFEACYNLVRNPPPENELVGTEPFCDRDRKAGCVLCCVLIFVVVTAVIVNNNSSNPPTSTPQPSTTPFPTRNGTNEPIPTMKLLERRICPSNETLNKLFSKYAFQSNSTANFELLNDLKWTQVAIDQDIVAKSCINQPQDCAPSVNEFKEFCEASHKYV